jgi:rhamnogalacturonan endolyase
MDPSRAELREVWGDGNANRSERYLAGIAYLDGRRPSLVMCRGYYTRTVLAAWNWRDGRLTHEWTFDSDDGTPGNRAFRGQGNHSLSIADVDGDGRDEIVYGSCVIDDDGRGLYSTGLGHGDALHVSDLDPARLGLEVFNIQERVDDAGANFRDARTGEILWKKPTNRERRRAGPRARRGH